MRKRRRLAHRSRRRGAVDGLPRVRPVVAQLLSGCSVLQHNNSTNRQRRLSCAKSSEDSTSLVGRSPLWKLERKRSSCGSLPALVL